MRCSNGWTAWVDGRRLWPLEPPAATAAPAATTPQATTAPVAAVTPQARQQAPQLAQAPSWARPWWPVGISSWAALGAALVLLGSFLPWFSFGPLSYTAWDIPVRYLLTGKGGLTGPRDGLLLLIPVLAIILPAVTRRPLPFWAMLIIASLATESAGFAIGRAIVATQGARPGLGVGVFVVLAGGLLMVRECWRFRPAWARER